MWTFLGISKVSPGFAIAITADCINPEAPLTPKKHRFAPNFLENSLWVLAITPLWDRGEPISGSSGKSQYPGSFFNNFTNFLGKAAPLLWAGKKSDLITF